MINNKKIVLTGCNSGIGLEVLKILLKGENKILCVDKDIDVLKSLNSEKIIILQKDVSSKEAVDEVFEFAEENLGIIDIFFANAGYAYYEEIDYTDWDRVERIFKTNVFSPIYSYQKYIKHLGGRKGVFAVTISAIGTMAMPGFTLYSSTKFALHGFQQGIRFEKPENMQLACIYPVATNTNFFKTANQMDFKRPFPVQQPDVVARKAVKGIEKGRKTVSPSALFIISQQLMKFLPFVRSAYWALENKKFREFRKRARENKAQTPKEEITV